MDDLKRRIELLEARRVYQMDITPQAVKVRHFGEGNPYIYAGLEADLPTSGVEVTSSVSIYFCTDSGKLKIWNGSVWKSVTLG